jgi:Lrp/AsnC family transcriptional regulator, leucine-responsive regulatory protein
MTETLVLDAIDQRILAVLRADGRVTMQDLGARVGLSPTPCARRVARLEGAGVIRGYAAQVDEARLGQGVSVFVSVRLDRQVDDALRTFEAQVARFPEVVDCWLMTGTRDYLMRVATPDLAAFEAFLTRRLTRVPGVASIESSLSLRRVKGGGAG